ncbi:hypothetical protein ACLHT2_32250, partial [Pseudomonas aeruginosa]
AAALVDLSTVAGNKISNPPWVKFQSAGWVNFPSAPTAWLSREYEIPLDDAFLSGVAFTIGLLAMNIIPGLKAAVTAITERFLPTRGT